MATVFVERDQDVTSPRFGKVKGVYKAKQANTVTDVPIKDADGEIVGWKPDPNVTPTYFADEELASDHADVVEFYSYQSDLWKPKAQTISDGKLAELLIQKGLITAQDIAEATANQDG